MKSEIGKMWLQAKDLLVPPEAIKAKEGFSAYGLQREWDPADMVILDC